MALNFDNTGSGSVVFKNPSSGTLTLVLPSTSGSSGALLQTDGSGNLSWTTAVWTPTNDGSGSGLDADLLDGQDSTFYTNITARLGYTPLNKAGDSMSAGFLTLFQDPSSALHAATKQYVDALLGVSRQFKKPVRLATTGSSITLSGGTPNLVDGITVLVNDRILVKDQSSGVQNGIYTVQTVGSGANGTWVRATDSDEDIEMTAGTYVYVNEGNTFADTSFVISTNDPITLGVTSLTWVQFSGLGQIIAGAGLTKTGNQLDVGGTSGRISVATDTVDIDATYVGQTSIVTLGTVTTGSWNSNILLSGAKTISVNPTSVGTIDNVNIGATTKGSGAFTTLTANGAATLTANTSSTTTGTGTLVVTGGVGMSENLNVGGNVIVTGNLTVNGTTESINSTVTTVQDPILDIGGGTNGAAPVSNDSKDRGIKFQWFSGSAKVGFFGYDNSTGFFTFVPDGTLTGEVISGTQGTIEAGAFKPTASTVPGNGEYLPATNTLGWATNTTARASIDSNGNFIINTAAISTSATDGFLYITSSAGKPTGVPTTLTGRFPVHIDSTDNIGTTYARLSANGAVGWYPAGKRRRTSIAATTGSAPTVSFDCSLADTFDLTLGHTGNATLNFTNAYDGQQVVVRLRQDATGSRTVTWGAMVRFGTDITSITLTATLNKTDYVGLTFHNGDSKYDVVALTRGF